MCIGDLPNTILSVIEVETSKCHPRSGPRVRFPASIQGEISLKKRLRSNWQETSDSALKAEVNRLPRSVTHRLHEWRN